VAARQALQLEQVLQFGPDAHQKNDGYAWCWGAVTFLDNHPRYKERFRTLTGRVNALEFNEEFLKLFAPDLDELREEWQVFVSNVEHAYDQSKMVVDFSTGKPLSLDGATISVPANGGWLNTGIQLSAGKSYDLRATGRYQLATEP